MVTAIITEISADSEFSIANSRRTHATLGLAPNSLPEQEARFEATFPATATAAGMSVTVQRGAQSLVLPLPAPVEQTDTGTFADRLVGWSTLDISGTLTLRLRVRDLRGTVSSEEWLLKLSDVPATTTVGVRGRANCQVRPVEADPLVEVRTASQSLPEREAAQVRAAAARNMRPLPMVGCDGLALLWAQVTGDPVSAPAGPTSMGPTTLPNPAPPPPTIPACLGEATVTLPAVQVATPLHYTFAAVAGEFSATGAAVVTVLPVADTPTVTPATTREDTQTTAGLEITRNLADGPEVTHFKITNISGGMLFQHDGTTAITNNTFITAAEGSAGLRFTPNSTASGSFLVWASLAPDDSGLGAAAPATATIAVLPPQITVTIDPQSRTIILGQPQQFAAIVSGTTNRAVTWSITGPGTISGTGLYQAPATLQTPATVEVRATSQADPAKSAAATVTIPEVSVSVQPPSRTLNGAGSQQQFSATVGNAPNTGVTWRVTGGGYISSTGLFTAEAGWNDLFDVIATSVADDTKNGRATIDVFTE